MAGNQRANQNISSGSAVDTGFSFAGNLAGQAVIINTCGEFHRITFTNTGISGSSAIGAFLADDLSASAAFATGLHRCDLSENRIGGNSDLALAFTVRAGVGSRAGLGAASLTGFTLLLRIHLNFFLYTENSFLEG